MRAAQTSPFPLFMTIALAALLSSCGVKGPPLPPIPATPQQSDRLAPGQQPAPLPSPAGGQS